MELRGLGFGRRETDHKVSRIMIIMKGLGQYTELHYRMNTGYRVRANHYK